MRWRSQAGTDFLWDQNNILYRQAESVPAAHCKLRDYDWLNLHMGQMIFVLWRVKSSPIDLEICFKPIHLLMSKLQCIKKKALKDQEKKAEVQGRQMEHLGHLLGDIKIPER